MEAINEVLKKLRKKNGYTQQQIADVLALEVSSYGKKELGQSDISLRQLESISNFYKMSVLELLAYPDTITINDKEETQLILQVVVGKDKKNDVLKVIQEKKLYNLLKE